MGSGLAAFEELTRGAQRVALDTSACIYFLGNRRPWVRMMRSVIALAQDRKCDLELSSIVQLELLVRPIRERSEAEIERVMTFTERGPNVRLSPIDRETVMLGARVRASTGLSVPDALVVAAASVSRCDLMIGNDRRFKRIEEISAGRDMFGTTVNLPQYIHLDDYIDAA